MITETLVNPFIGKKKPPTTEELHKALGRSKAAWFELLDQLARELDVCDHEWNSYSPKAGWALKVKKGQRTILYMSPRSERFIVSFILGGKAIKAALASRLSSTISEAVRDGKKYPEGTGVRFEVASNKDLDSIKKIVVAKVNN